MSGYTIEDINAIYDLKHAWQFLLDNISEELNLAFVRKVHMILGRYTIINAGTFRRDEVRIGGTDWIPELPDEKKAESELGNILESKTASISKALDLTVYLMRAQLFYDGNKRIAMLIGNKLMIENGQGIISVAQKDIKDFYKLLASYYETGDQSDLKQFLYDHCINGMMFHH